MITSLEIRSLYEGDPSLSFTTLEIPLFGAHNNDIVVRNITGLEPSPAVVNTVPMGDLDEEFFVGSHLGKRNIVITLGLNTKLGVQSVDDIRNRVYAYGVLPTKLVGLRFIFDNHPPHEIKGYVETVTNDRFSKDPQVVISVICPKPNFLSTQEITVTGDGNDDWLEFDMNGNQVVGFTFKMELDASHDIGPGTDMFIETGTAVAAFATKKYKLENITVPGGATLELNSNRGLKFIQYSVDDEVHSLLDFMTPESLWPYLVPGYNRFRIRTPSEPYIDEAWELKYYEAYGSV